MHDHHNNQSDRSQSTSSTLSSSLSSLVTSTPPLDKTRTLGSVASDDSIDPTLIAPPCRQPFQPQQKIRPPSPQDFLHPSSTSAAGFSTLPHQTTHFSSSGGQSTDHPSSSFSYPTPAAAAYNIHFPSPLFSVSSSIAYAAAPMTSHQTVGSPFATGGGVGYNNSPARLPGILSPSVSHARPDTAGGTSNNSLNDADAARRGPPTPLPFTHPYSAGYYISTGLTPLYASTQFRAIQGDPFFGAVSHFTPTPSCSSFEAAQQGFTGPFPPTPHAYVHAQARYHDQAKMADQQQQQQRRPDNGGETSMAQDHKNDASQAADIDQKPTKSTLADDQASQEQATQSPQLTEQQVQMPTGVQPHLVNPAPFDGRPQYATSSVPLQNSVSFEYPLSAGYGNQIPASAPGFAINGHHAHNRLPSIAFPSSAPIFGHHPHHPAAHQTYSVYFSADGQAHYIPNNAITDMNGNFTTTTYAAYPPQAFQPAQPMPHHTWARQQNAFAYHYGGETDVEMDGQATPPENQYQRHGAKSVTPYSDRDARYEDDDDDDEEEENDQYSTFRLPYPPASKGLKRSRSYSRMSSPDESVVSGVDEWQPKRKMTAKKGMPSLSSMNGPARKNVAAESRRPPFAARKSGSKKSATSAGSDVDDGEIRYTTNAEDKQTDRLCNRCGIYEKTHRVPRPVPLDEIPNQSSRVAPPPAKKSKKSIKELGLKSLHIANPVSVAARSNAGRENEQGARRRVNARGIEEHHSEDESDEDRRISLNSNFSGRSAGVASTASDLTTSTFGPQTPLSGHDASLIFPGGTSMMRKPSRGARVQVEQEDMPYRTFTRPMVVHNKNGGVKAFSAGKPGKAASKSARARPTARAVHQLKRSGRSDEDEDDE
ncbi:hypothetical protein QFC21_006583 [Naganishia friedmannii]|uniref:Uncharacterized protein n=1 Tax=Naganishia friedmannii TaxID=89922 RepID=A0ACC2V263_9TREE|nr:hypothetical protein QFC21_006583 [Naganishia friedmannii]